MSLKIVRNNFLAKQIVFIDGLPGCGKTLFSSLLSSFERVEKITYSYEIEHLCAIHHLKRSELDPTIAMVKMLTDLLVYDMMMSRNVNCRPSDLSSIFRHPNCWMYLKRLFQKGDMLIPDRISKEKPILSLTVHNLLSIATPIFQALENRVVFVEIVRHPLYMIIQQALNNKRMIFNARDFTIYYDYNGKELPWYVHGWEEEFLLANPVEKAIHFIDKVGGLMDSSRDQNNSMFPGQILTIPFEKFVINPEPFMVELEKVLGSKITQTTRRVLRKQNVPRKKFSEGIPLDIYKRCGWIPSDENLSEIGEFNIRRQYVVENASKETVAILDRLCADYEEIYMGGRLIGENGYKVSKSVKIK